MREGRTKAAEDEWTPIGTSGSRELSMWGGGGLETTHHPLQVPRVCVRVSEC